MLNKRHIWSAAFMGLLLMGSFQNATAQELKIAVVDLEGVIALSDMGKALQEKLKAFRQETQGQLKTLNDKAAEIEKQATAGGAALSEQKLAELRRQFEDAKIDINRMRKDKQAEAQGIRDQGLKEIEVALQPVFDEIQKEEAYDIILNKATGVVIMASEKADISQKVLDRLNAATKK